MLMERNFGSSFHMCQLAYPLLDASGARHVVCTSYVSCFVSLKNMSVHGASKGAINHLTRNLACEWARDGIRVNAVAPWFIRTSMVEQWDPPTLESLDAGKIEQVFQPFEEDLELKIPAGDGFRWQGKYED